MSRVTDIADAVVAALNAAEFALPFTAERRYRPVFGLAELETLRVSVVPASVEDDTATRGCTQEDPQIDVGVQQKVADTENETLDPLEDLAEAIADHFRQQRLPGHPTAICTKASRNPLYVPEHLDTKKVFLAIVRLTFRTWR